MRRATASVAPREPLSWDHGSHAGSRTGVIRLRGLILTSVEQPPPPPRVSRRASQRLPADRTDVVESLVVWA